VKKSFGPKTLAYPTPVWCVGSYDGEGKPNIMTVAWGGICCSSPPCVTISLRKATHTYGNILERGAYTINIPSERFVREADFFGMTSGRDTDKFTHTALTPVRGAHVDAPYVEEFPMVLECKLIHSHEIGLHTQFIGEILDVKAEETLLNEKGLPDMALIRPLIYSPETRYYYGVGNTLGEGFSIGKSL